jgi:hypothetical protein
MMDVIVWMIYGVGVVDVYVYMDEWMDMCMEIWRALMRTRGVITKLRINILYRKRGDAKRR